jgi:hypothetical protein
MAGARIQLKRATASAWASANTVLFSGEIGLETDTNKFKIGNGSTAFNSLPYFNGNLAGSNLNDLADVTIVSASDGDFLRWNGTAWINDAVNLSTDTVGNYVVDVTGGTGVTITHTPGEGSTASVAIGQSVATSDVPTFAGLNLNGNVVFEGTTANEFETTLTVIDPTADRTITFPDATGTVVTTGDTGSVTSTMIVDGTIVNTDINASASIALSKLASGTSAQVVIANSSGVPTYTTLSGDVTISDTGVASIAANSVALGTDTTGNYMADVSAGTGITVTHTVGEGSTATVAVDTTIIQARVTDVSDTEIGYLNGVTSAIQTQIDSKAPLASPTFTGTVTVPTPINNTDASTKTYVDSTASTTASNASTALTNHEADTTNIHGIADTSILVTTTGTQTLTNKTITSPAGLVKGDVGLGNVDNTSDANKPVSTATQTALDLKANLASPTFTGTPTLPTGTIATTQTAGNNSTAVATTAYVQTAVSNLVDTAPEALNTLNELAAALGDDANFATTTATNLGLKAPLASPTFTGTVTVPTPVNNTDASTKAYVDSTVSTTAGTASTALSNHESDTTNIHGIADTSILVTTTGTQTLTNKTITTPTGLVKNDVGLGNVDNTSDANKPVSTAGQTALDLKANLDSPTLTGTPTLPTGTIAVTQTLGNNTTAVATTEFIQTALANFGGMTVSDTPPTVDVGAGDFWWDSTGLNLYIYYSSNWVQVSSEDPVFFELSELLGVEIDNGLLPNHTLRFDGPTGNWVNSAPRQNVGTITATSYSVSASDSGKVLLFNNASAISVNLGSWSASVGEKVDIVRYGTGQVTVTVSGSVTTVSAGGSVTTRAQYSLITATCVASNTFLLSGDLT